MLSVLARLSGLFTSRRKGKMRGRLQPSDIYPTLQVRTLEERRVFHAGAIAAPVAGATTQQQPPPPPPAPTITVSLDSAQNLVIRDASAAVQGDQLSIRLDAAAGRYVITDPNHTLQTSIAGATGSGSHSVFIPVTAVTGSKLIIDGGAGNDALAVDLSGGLGGKSLVFDGGAGQDSLVLRGGFYGSVSYAFAGDSSARIQIGSGQSALRIELASVEPVLDQLAAGNRQFTLGSGVSHATLGDDADPASDLSQLTTSLGTSVTFAAPGNALNLEAANESTIDIAGRLNLHGSDLTVRGGAIEVSGTIASHAATIDLSAKSSLTVTASGRIENQSGRVFLDAGENGTLKVFGRIDVSASSVGDIGGTVHLLGKQVELRDGAAIDASGRSGGGTVLVGGDYQGLNPAIRRATNTLVSANASINASATHNGNGGKIIVWADHSAIVAGSGNLHARGGAQGGNGGLIETSGKRYLYVDAAPDAAGPAGAAGTWLLDPDDVTIVAGGTGALTGGVFESSPGTTTIAPVTITNALATMDVTIRTGTGNSGNGDITVQDAIVAAVGVTHTLTLEAARDILIDANISGSGGLLGVILDAGRNVTFVDSSISARTVNITAGGTVTSGSALNDIVVSGAGASIVITGNSIGAAGAPVDLSIGATGTASLSAITGGIFVRFASSIDTSQLTLSAAGNNQTISLATQNGSIEFDGVGQFAGNTADDNFVVQTGGANNDIDFTGGSTLIARSVSLTATGDIETSSSSPIANTSTFAGTISLAADDLGSAANPLRLNPGTGNLQLTATNGDIFIRVSAGDLVTSRIATLSVAQAGATISLGADSGGVQMDQVSQFNGNTANDDFTLLAGTGNITLSSPTALVAANAFLTANSGSILATNIVAQFTVGATGLIRLTSNAVGTAANSVVINPTTGDVEVFADAGDVYLAFASSFATSQILKLDVAQANAQIELTAATGSIIVDATSQFSPNTEDDHFTLLAPAGGVAFTGGTLRADSVTIDAQTTITRSGGATSDINASPLGGPVTLSADGGIGTSAERLRISANTGVVTATTASGDIWLRSPGNMNLGVMQTGSGQQTVAVSAGGALTIGASSTTDDNWQLDAAGNISLVGNVTLRAGVFSIVSGGNLIGGTAAVDFWQIGPAAALVMNADAIGSVANPIIADLRPLNAIDPPGLLNLTATAGDLCLLLAAGDLTDSRFVNNTISAPANNQTIYLGTLNGSVMFGNLPFLSTSFTGDDLILEARGSLGNIDLGSTTLVFESVTLRADGQIMNANGTVAINTSAANGNITLESGGSIGVLGTPLIVEAGGGLVSATTTGPLGHIFLQSSGNLLLGQFDALDPGTQIISLTTTSGAMQITSNWNTEDDLRLTAASNITFTGTASLVAAAVSLTSGGVIQSGTAAVDIDTSTTANGYPGSITLAADSIATSGNPLTLNPGGDPVSATTTVGDAYLAISSGAGTPLNFRLSEFALLNIASGATFSLDVLDGNLTVDAPFFSLFNNHVALSAAGTGGNLLFIPGFPLVSQSADLRATGVIQGSGDPFDIATLAGNIVLSADLGIGAGSPLSVITDAASSVRATTVTGDVLLRSPLALNLGQVTTGGGSQDVQIDADGGLVIVADSSTDDDWVINSVGGGLAFGGGNTITAASFSATVSGNVSGDGTTINIDTSIAGGPISLTGAAIGNSVQHAVLAVGAGNLSLLANSGQLWVDVRGGDLLGSQIENFQASGVGMSVGLATLDGSLILNDVSEFRVSDDNLTLAATGGAGDIDFADNIPLRAAQATLDAAGSIVSSGNALIDLDTSQFNGPITLEAGDNIGSQADPLLVKAAGGGVSATANAGDIYVESPGPLRVIHAEASAPGRQISFETTATNGTPSTLTVTVNSLGDPLDDWHLAAAGNIALTVTSAAGINFNQILDLRAIGSGRNVLVHATSGPIFIGNVHAGVMTGDDILALDADGGDIQSAPGETLHASRLSLEASGSIGSGVNAIEFLAPRLTTSSTGSQWLAAQGTTRATMLETTGIASNITLGSGTFWLDPAVAGGVAARTPGGALLVDTGAELGGHGDVQGNLRVLSDGRVDMGFGNHSAGNLHVFGSVTFDADSTLVVDINAPYTVPGTDYDHLALTGNLTLQSSTLHLEGADQLRVTISPIVLVDLLNPGATRSGRFEVDGLSLFQDGPFVRVQVGQFRGKLFYDRGTDNNDIVISELSLTPPIQQTRVPLPEIYIPVFTRVDAPLPVVQPPPPLATSPQPPAVEVDTQPESLRFIEIRIVVPIDDAGNVREEFALKLPAEWLTNLPAILRRLPDDHYRIYLMLEGGSEERLVIDVLVRDGRPVEPTDATDELGSSTTTLPAGESSVPSPTAAPTPAEPNGPAPEIVPLPALRPASRNEHGLIPPGEAGSAGRMFVGTGAVALAIVASRRPRERRNEEIDKAAEAIARAPASVGWRWWRLAGSRALHSDD